MKISRIPLILGLLVLASITVYAASNLVPSILNTPGTTRVIELPPQAANSHVISLGEAIDEETGMTVEGYMFIFEEEGEIKPGQANGPKDKTCYSYLAYGANWKHTEPYILDTRNNAGLDEAAISAVTESAVAVWEDEHNKDIFGEQSLGEVTVGQTRLNGKNELYFANISGSRAIGITTLWGRFSGKEKDRMLVEWDMVLNDGIYEWSAETEGVPGKMDLANMVTHELGHALGLGHPSLDCMDETMYRYGYKGETKKRDLHDGDIKGLKKLY